jgi:hypothetical protein
MGHRGLRGDCVRDCDAVIEFERPADHVVRVWHREGFRYSILALECASWALVRMR